MALVRDMLMVDSLGYKHYFECRLQRLEISCILTYVGFCSTVLQNSSTCSLFLN